MIDAVAGGEPAGIDAELLRQASELEGDPNPAGPQPAAPGAPSPGVAPAGDPMADASELIEFVYDGVTPAYPGLVPIYSPEVRKRLADRLGRVMQKYNLSLAAIFAKWAPEIGLVMVTLPLVQPTVEVIRAQREKDRAERDAAKARSAQPPNPNAPAAA